MQVLTHMSSPSTSPTSTGPSKAKQLCKGSQLTSTTLADLTTELGFDNEPALVIQEAFGSLLNTQDIIGATLESLAEEVEGEVAFKGFYEKLHCPTPSISGSLAVAQVPANSYSQPTEAFTLAVAVNACLKLQILKSLFVPFEVLLASDKCISIHQYLLKPFLTPDTDPKMRMSFPHLTIKRWTHVFIVYMHFYCKRFLEQRDPMYISVCTSFAQWNSLSPLAPGWVTTKNSGSTVNPTLLCLGNHFTHRYIFSM